MTRYEWVTDRKAEGFPINMACDVAEVSRQTFYDWQTRVADGPTDTEQSEAVLVAEMCEIHKDFDGTYGEPRMTVELEDRGHRVNKKPVARLMRTHGIVGIHKPEKKKTTIGGGDYLSIPDLIRRKFAPGCPDVAWVSDITYVPTSQGWLYLATVIDLGSRRLLGYSMAPHMRTELVTDALDMAVNVRGDRTKGIIFHSDRGSQYTSSDFQQQLNDLGMLQSVGRTGVCYDNAVAESFFSSLKRELVHRHRFKTRDTARRAIFTWIVQYNTRRLHSSLNYQPPIEWENTYNQNTISKAA